MAISMNRYVSIQSGVADAVLGNRELGGLVFCSDNMKTGAVDKTNYDAGIPVRLTLDSVKAEFDTTTDIYKYAQKYFAYTGPSGNSPVAITVAKMLNAESPLTAFNRVDGLTNNFGSFTFLGVVVTSTPSAWAASHAYAVGDVVTNSGSPYICTVAHTSASTFDASKWEKAYKSYTTTELEAVAEENAALDWKYLMVINALPTDYDDIVEAIGEYQGMCYVIGNDHYAARLIQSVAASTDYGATNSATVFMYKTFDGELPTVTTDALADALDASHVNYYGRTQTNGKTIDFLQRGVLSNGDDIACYCNELWFKSAIITSVVNLFTSVEKVPADSDGSAMIANIVNEVCSNAITNGVILVGKNLDATQKQTIFSLTNDKNAATLVEEQGYWLRCVIVKEGTEYKCKYRCVYSKGDAIRKVEGVHNLV